MIPHKGILVLLCIVAATRVSAQNNCTLSASVEVFEVHTHEAIAFPRLLISPGNIQVIGDSVGTITINSLCPGKYTFTIAATGYKSADFTALLPMTLPLHVDLAHDPGQLKEVTVNSRFARPQLLQSQESIYTNALRQASGKGLTDALQSINGVTMISTGAPSPSPLFMV